MNKGMWIAIAGALTISIAALGIAIAGFQRLPAKEEAIQLVEAPPIEVEFEGPVYTGTGTGYIIEFENGTRFYFAGDTCLFSDMGFVVGDYYKPDVAFLPVGDVYTMDSKAAAYATTLTNPKYVIPYHYHTFPELTQDAAEFASKVNEYRKNGDTKAEPIVLEPGVEQEEVEGVKVMWLGHATILFEAPSGTRIIIDPWLEANPDCPSKYKDIDALEDVDLILLTHGHVDHVTYDELEKLWELYHPAIIAQWELGIYLQGKMAAPIAMMNKGGTLTKEKILAQEIVTDVSMIKEDIKITMVQADHSSSPP